MTALALRLPTIAAILALAYLGDRMTARGIDGGIALLIVSGICGLGGYYLREFRDAHPSRRRSN